MSGQVPDGMLIPPPMIKAAILKTVDFTQRRGEEFINRIKDKEGDNPRFSFLKPDDTYHPYYQWYIEEYKQGRAKEAPNNQQGPTGQATTTQQTGATRPRDYEFVFKLPNVSAQDLGIIKLSALYVAQNGRQFRVQLAHREEGNFQYEFLKPTHSLHPLFEHLVDQYTKTLRLKEDTRLQQKLDEGINNRYAVLARAKDRAEFESQQEEKAKERAQQEEKDRLEFAQIDWGNFVVVQTIQFTNADYQTPLPVPLSLSQLQYASLEQKKMGVQMIEEAEPDFEPQDDDLVQPSVPAQPEHDAPEPVSAPAQSNLNIKTKSRRQRKAETTGQTAQYISPITGEAVAVEQYNEHMRISQLDPKYRQYKQIEESRKATSNLNEAEAEANLKRMHSAMYQANDSEKDDSQSQSRKRREIGPTK